MATLDPRHWLPNVSQLLRAVARPSARFDRFTTPARGALHRDPALGDPHVLDVRVGHPGRARLVGQAGDRLANGGFVWLRGGSVVSRRARPVGDGMLRSEDGRAEP